MSASYWSCIKGLLSQKPSQGHHTAKHTHTHTHTHVTSDRFFCDILTRNDWLIMWLVFHVKNRKKELSLNPTILSSYCSKLSFSDEILTDPMTEKHVSLLQRSDSSISWNSKLREASAMHVSLLLRFWPNWCEATSFFKLWADAILCKSHTNIVWRPNEVIHMHWQIKGTVFILRVLTVLLVTHLVQLEVRGHHTSHESLSSQSAMWRRHMM